MNRGQLRLLLVVALALCCAGATTVRRGLQTPPGSLHWYKGNTHTHTLNSDGDSTPDDVVRWYREHGYQFLVLTDHNFQTRVDVLNALHGADDQFLVVKGEEVTSSAAGKPVHVNGLDANRRLGAQSGAADSTVLDVLQRSVDAVRGASGVPHINHPNFGWALTIEDLRRVRGYKLFEIFNGHPEVNNLGGGNVPGLEEIWDRLLSSGTLVYGIAVDDAHVFRKAGDPTVAGPGRGWVVVRAPQLDARALLEAMERGDFYASTGVVLDDLVVTSKSMTIKVKPLASSKYRVQFIARDGRVLTEVPDASATYTFTGAEGYVRAKVIESNGRFAWIQPVIVNP